MAKLGDIFNSLFSLSPDKDYEFDIKEKTQEQQQLQQPTDNQQQPTDNQQKPTDNQQKPTNSQQQMSKEETKYIENDILSMYKLLQDENEKLKKANFALLSHTPVEEENLTIEDMIYRSVFGNPKRKEG